MTKWIEGHYQTDEGAELEDAKDEARALREHLAAVLDQVERERNKRGLWHSERCDCVTCKARAALAGKGEK